MRTCAEIIALVETAQQQYGKLSEWGHDPQSFYFRFADRVLTIPRLRLKPARWSNDGRATDG